MGKIIEKTLYGLDDITIVPAVTSNIEHRAECKVTAHKFTNELPIFVAPMDTVIGLENYKIYKENNVIPIIPRTVPFDERFNKLVEEEWVAFSLDEYKELFCSYEESPLYNWINESIEKAKEANMPLSISPLKIKALIDIANGHISKLLDLLKTSKEIARNNSINISLEVMVGNIANPETFKILSEAGADYVRCSIGSGGLCFIDGTKITLYDGSKKNIEDINIGDIVKTHNNDAKVINVIRFNTNKELITINNEITCTSEHKFYVVNKTDKDKVSEENLDSYAYWLEANKLDPNIHLLIKKY